MEGCNNNNNNKSSWSPAPLSCDCEAAVLRESIEYPLNVDLKDALEGKAGRQVRVYATGVFDLFHFGHARQLMQIRANFKNPGDVYVIVGTVSDEEVSKRKGPTVTTEEERCESLRHCRYVDEVVPVAPFVLNPAFILEHKIDFVAHDDLPYPSNGSGDIFKWLRDAGMFLGTQRTPGISTTDLISRIIHRAEDFITRKLNRQNSSKAKKLSSSSAPLNNVGNTISSSVRHSLGSRKKLSEQPGETN